MSGFDTRITVEERFPDRCAPMSYAEQVANMTDAERADFDAVNRSITIFGVLVVLGFLMSIGVIAYATFLHLSR